MKIFLSFKLLYLLLRLSYLRMLLKLGVSNLHLLYFFIILELLLAIIIIRYLILKKPIVWLIINMNSFVAVLHAFIVLICLLTIIF